MPKVLPSERGPLISPSSSDTVDSKIWASNYESSREKFLREAGRAGLEIFSLPLRTEATGSDEAPLFVDLGWLGSTQPVKCFIHISGTHGVEGYAGDAIQTHLLKLIHKGEYKLEADEALLFIHVLNPYGMSHSRRWNENNVDLNRNWLKSGNYNLGPLSREYLACSSMLNPVEYPKSCCGINTFKFQAAGKIMRYGYNTLKQAIAGGQYAEPKFLFFGGSALQPSLVALQEWFESSRRLNSCFTVVGIDVHTGLGKKGYDTLLTTCDDWDVSILKKELGDKRVVPTDPSQGVGYRVEGCVLDGIEKFLPVGCRWLSIVQEFGTSPPLHVLDVLRKENYTHHYARGTVMDTAAKSAVRDAFYPSRDQRWCSTVIHRGQRVFEQMFDIMRHL